MNRFWKDMGIAVVMGLLVPTILLSAVVAIAADKQAGTEKMEEAVQSTALPSVMETQPSAVLLTVLDDNGELRDMELHDYLTCVVLAEMPVSFADEALKAQSVVARTYAIRAMEGASKHEEAAVCTDSGCCQGYMAAETYLQKGGKEQDVLRIRQLVDSTAGQVLTYDGNLIEATYFSCSGGATEDAVAVWGTDVPYLQSVESPGEEHATHYTDTVTFSPEAFASKLGISLTGSPKAWIGKTTYTDGGGVDTIMIGNTAFFGTQLRKLLGLRSTAFEIEAAKDTITITTHGFGHRVGMSQYGADAMAESGSTYEEILTYYYQGTELARYTD